MPNTLRTQSRKAALWNDRPVLVLRERDGRDCRYHGVWIGPAGMTVAHALVKADRAFRKAVRDNRNKEEGGSDWNYDDVFENLKAAGFEEIRAAEWWEHHA